MVLKFKDKYNIKNIFIILITISFIFFNSNLVFSLNNISDSNSYLQIKTTYDLLPTTYYTHKNITFYANYTHLNTTPIGLEGECLINITSITNNSYVNLSYNLSSNLFEYTNNFKLSGANLSYEIYCNSSIYSYNNINTKDNISINQNSNLNVFDYTTNGSLARKNTQIKFYANYTSIFTNSSISNASCNITFIDGTFSMIFNSSIYELNRNFTTDGLHYYNVTCIDDNFTQIDVYNNSIYLTPIFELGDFNINNLDYSSIIIDDYDNDNSDEILISGYNGTSSNFSGYNYTSQNFINVDFESIKPFHKGSMLSADFNNDDFSDLITCGINSSSQPQTNLYLNNKGDLTKINSSIIDLSLCSISGADFDNEGFVDLIISGSSDGLYSGAKTYIYRNINGSFVLFQNFTGVYNSANLFVDLNNDGYKDIIFLGKFGVNNYDLITSIYTYNYTTNNFTYNSNLQNLSFGNIISGDFNEDTYQDIIISGRSNEIQFNSAQTLVYLNDGFGNLIQSSNLSGFSQGSISSADIDADGHLDLILSGINMSNLAQTQIYYGIGNGSFILDNLNLGGFKLSSQAFFDYDNDSDLDFIISGFDEFGDYNTTIFENTNSNFILNNAPTIPSINNVNYDFYNQTLNIYWTGGVDDITNTNSLTYLIEVKTYDSETLIFSGRKLISSNPVNGYFGTFSMLNNPIKIHTKYNSYYEIKMKTIDLGLLSSPWSSEYIYSICPSFDSNQDWNITFNCVLMNNNSILFTSTSRNINILNGSKLILDNSQINLMSDNILKSKINIINGSLILKNNSKISSSNAQSIEINIFNNSYIKIENSSLEYLSEMLFNNSNLISSQIINSYLTSSSNLNITLVNSTMLVKNSSLSSNTNLFLENSSNFNSTNSTYLNLNYNVSSNSELDFFRYITFYFTTENIKLDFIDAFLNYKSINSTGKNITLELQDNSSLEYNNFSYSNYIFNFTKSGFFGKYFQEYNLSIINSSIYLDINSTGEPDFDEFQNNITTNFTYYANVISNLTITNAIIAVPNIALINFTSSVDFTNLNLSKLIKIGNNSIYVNSILEPKLNTSATLNFYNLSFIKTPLILKDDVLCSNCSLNYYSNGNLSFNVNGFSNYTLTQNSYLNWYDQENTCNIYSQNSTISFRYYNATDNSKILSAQCFISIGSISNQSMINILGDYIFTNNSISIGYQNFSIYCNSTQDFEPQIYSGTIYIKNDNYDSQYIQDDFDFQAVWKGSIISLNQGVLITGNDNLSIDTIKYYSIQNNTFIENNSRIAVINAISGPNFGSSVANFDFNNDGYEDLVLIGGNTNNERFEIYRGTQNGVFQSVTIQNSFGVTDGSIDISDVNNDGYQDILVTGKKSTNNIFSFVLINNKGSFDFNNNITLTNPIYFGTALFIDLNNDGYIDIVSSGKDVSNNIVSQIYLNQNGINFSLSSSLPISTYQNSLAIGDIDNDFDFDLLIDGSANLANTLIYSNLYRNDNGIFNLDNSLNKTRLSSNIFFDSNLNGEEDLVSIGSNVALTNLIGDISFNSTKKISLLALRHSSSLIFDSNNDSALDILISGKNSSNSPITKLYLNDANLCNINHEPSVPVISAQYNETTNTLFINWTNSSDVEGGSVTYNLRIGNAKNGANAIYSSIIPKTTRPNNAGIGNMQFRTNITINNFSKQCYYIEIQAIDNSLKKSNWSNQIIGSFTEIKDNIYDEDCDGIAQITAQASSGGGSGSTSSKATTSPTETNPENTPETTVPSQVVSEPTQTNPTQNQDQVNTDETSSPIASNTDNSKSSAGSSSGKTTTEQNIFDKTKNLSATTGVSLETFDKIFENTIGHKRNILYSNDKKTQVQEEITNKFFYDVENITIRIIIPKEVISSASKDINWKKSSNFTIIDDDPIIEYKITKLEAGKKYYLIYEFNDNINYEKIDNIILNITYNNIIDDQEEFLNKASQTKEFLDINQNVDTDYENNKTKYTLDLDFKNESVLYNVSIYQEIPKCLVEIINDEFIDSNYDFEIVAEDPVIVWHFDEISKDEKIEFAIKSVAGDDCSNSAKTFAVAKSIFIFNKEINWGVFYFDNQDEFRFGITGALIFLILFSILLLWFSSFTQTNSDKLRLAMLVDKVKDYKKSSNFSNEEIILKLRESDEITDEEILEIFTKNILKKIIIWMEIGIEELILLIFILITLCDAFQILPGDLDFLNKIISLVVLSYLFYYISPTKLLFGVRHRVSDALILIAFFMLSLKVYIVYAIGAIQDMRYFIDLITVLIKYSSFIEVVFFTIGGFIIFITSLFLSRKIIIESGSVLSHLKFNFERFKLFKFIMMYLVIMLFFTTIYNLTLEWLAIAVDAPLAVICIGAYIIHIIKSKDLNFNNFLNNISNSISNFYTKVLNLFTIRGKFALGASGLLILHILTELGNYIFPYITGRLDSLYFSVSAGTENLNDALGNIVKLIDTGHAPFFSINDFLSSEPSSIFSYQILNIDSWVQALNLLLQYIFNLYFLIFLIVMPGVIWWHMYKYSENREYKNHKIEINKWIIALFLISGTVVMFNPAFSIGFVSQSEYNQLLTGEDLIRGVDILTNPIAEDVSFWPIIIGVLISLIAFIPGLFKSFMNNTIAFVSLASFGAYLTLFFIQINSYYTNIISTGIAKGLSIGIFALMNITIFYILTIMFYFGGILFLVYELWNTKEMPFEPISENPISLEIEEIKKTIRETKFTEIKK